MINHAAVRLVGIYRKSRSTEARHFREKPRTANPGVD
jgi:hypothetical protein